MDKCSHLKKSVYRRMCNEKDCKNYSGYTFDVSHWLFPVHLKLLFNSKRIDSQGSLSGYYVWSHSFLIGVIGGIVAEKYDKKNRDSKGSK